MPHSTGQGRHNRLIHESSPYLLQHADNPVDWYPWGDEAFRRAEELDRPIFLSVGYSTCHWCHVMEHESFEDARIAELLNAGFVAIKVDREERPDVDAIYMRATQLLTGRGGWPNSVFLLPDGRPFFAGTYFPPEDYMGMPGFATVLTRVSELWNSRRDDVVAQAEQVTESLRRLAAGPAEQAPASLSRDLIDAAVQTLRREADMRHGGFGGPPKFPPHGALALLLHEHARTGETALLEPVVVTLDAMAAGGIRDHLGGGFHRYATDGRWFLPHFEKMLYDNAQLARAYAEAYAATHDDRYARVARQTLDFCLREMRDEGGGFYSAYDADSEGVEGKFYLWTRPELADVLGEADAELFGRAYGVEPGGNYRPEHGEGPGGQNILHLPRPIEQTAKVEGIAPQQLQRQLAAMREKLLAARAGRVRPGLDDKVLTSWNALMIGALARASAVLDEPAYARAAAESAEFVLAGLRRDGRLLRSWRDGQAKLGGYLDDYAFLIDALLDLHQATAQTRWLDEARALAEQMVERFAAPGGGFYFTADDHEAMLLRTKDPFDHALPSGNGKAARALVRLAEQTGEARWLDLAGQTLNAFVQHMKQAPQGAESLLLAASMYLDAGRPRAESGQAEPLTVTAECTPARAEAGATVEVSVHVAVADGWHIHAAQTDDPLLPPTRVTLTQSPLAAAGAPQYPPGETVELGFSRRPLKVYRGQVTITLPVTLAAHAAGQVELTVHVRAQPCSDRLCLEPRIFELKAPVEVAGPD